MANRFAAASRNFLRKPWKKFWWLPLWIIFEIIRDRLAGWANSQIDKQVENESGRLMEIIAHSVDYLVSTPLSWTISAAIIILILLFLHSYFHATPPAREAATKPAVVEASIPLPTSELLATANKPLSPDWSMKELCQHVLDNIDDSEEVIREIEAKARLGKLACWGRKYSTIKADDNPNPLRPIVPEHWDDFSLDYLRCATHDDPTECRTEPRSHLGDHTESYQDLQVNRQQARRLWTGMGVGPRSPTSQARETKAEALADFLFSADELIQRIVSSNDNMNKWKQDYQEWNTNVTNYIRNNISHTQAYHFSNPGMVVVRQFDGAYNEEHNSLLNSLAVRRENLRHLHSLES